MPVFVKAMTWNQFVQLCGIAAVATLLGVGGIDRATGIAFLTGLVGLSINTREAVPLVPLEAPVPAQGQQVV